MATAGPADRKLVNVVGIPPCQIIPCSDNRNFTIKGRFSVIDRLPVGLTRAQATCAIDEAYRCEVSFKSMNKPRGNVVAVMALVHGPSHGIQNVFVDLALLDNTRSLVTRPLMKKRYTAVGSSKRGCGLVVAKDFLEANCVKDDVVVAICTVVILPTSHPPSDESLCRRLAAMSSAQDLTDVCFDVDGEKFHAHRLVMAAQSEKFRAMLFDSNNNETILCEDTLCAGITTDTVNSTLALTDKRPYPKLRASCIEFLSETPIYNVASTDVYTELVQNYPGVLTEIRDYKKRPRLSLKLTPSTDTKIELKEIIEESSKRPRLLCPKPTPSTDTKDENQGELTENGESSKKPRLCPKPVIPSTDVKVEKN
uniref:BTB domain-containing protein n=1 Tax=Leersia perrieri TaxID=77586 RepID=A0A0D9XCN1_9ORYZ